MSGSCSIPPRPRGHPSSVKGELTNNCCGIQGFPRLSCTSPEAMTSSALSL